MSTVAFTGDLKVSSASNGVVITQEAENWGDPWPTQGSSITVRDVEGLIKALRAIQNEKSYDNW